MAIFYMNMTKATDSIASRVKKTVSRKASVSKQSDASIMEELPQLSVQLANGIGNILRRTQLTVFNDLSKRLKPYQLRPVHLGLIDIIVGYPGLSQSQASDALGVKKANFIVLLDELVDLGLARRAAGPDRRSYALYLTSHGEALFPQLWCLLAEHEQKVAETLGISEQRQLLKLLDKLSALGRQDPSIPS